MNSLVELHDDIDEKIPTFILRNDMNEKVGVAKINDELEFNKITIEIDKKYRGNGYGKELFDMAIDIYKERYGNGCIKFKSSDMRFCKIINDKGAYKISNENGIMGYALKL